LLFFFYINIILLLLVCIAKVYIVQSAFLLNRKSVTVMMMMILYTEYIQKEFNIFFAAYEFNIIKLCYLFLKNYILQWTKLKRVAQVENFIIWI
jgi:hypothetical protein